MTPRRPPLDDPKTPLPLAYASCQCANGVWSDRSTSAAARAPRARARANPSTATILVILDKAQQAEDILEPDEPRHYRQEDTYDRDGIAIGEEIGVHTQREAREQRHDLALLFPIDEV